MEELKEWERGVGKRDDQVEERGKKEMDGRRGLGEREREREKEERVRGEC